MTPAVDVHCHLFPEPFFTFARSYGPQLGVEFYRRPDGREYIRAPGDFDYPLSEDLWSVERLLQAMDRRGISLAVLSVAPPTLGYWAEAGLAADLATAANDFLAAVVRAHPDRFVALATVPLQAIDRAVAELERRMGQPEFRGAMIGTNVGGRNLDDPFFEPFWEAAESLGACLFVHPYQVLGRERLQRYYLWNLIGMVTETCVAIESLIFGGVYDRHPRLKTYFAHGGGSFPWVRGRAEHGFSAIKTTTFAAQHPPSAYLGRIFVDHMVYLPHGLTWLAGDLGSDHLMVGSDYPFDIGPTDPLALVHTAPGLSAADRENILWRTAVHLLGLTLPVSGAADKRRG